MSLDGSLLTTLYSTFGPWLFLVDEVKFRIEILMLLFRFRLGRVIKGSINRILCFALCNYQLDIIFKSQ